jgi:hypothetical protein
MKIKRFLKYTRNTLLGFVDVETPGGYIIKGLTFHRKGNSEWLGMPAKEYTNKEGQKGYAPMVDFATKNLYWEFCNDVIGALKEHLGQTTNENGEQDEDNTPF